jgi:hypothetical protein
MLIQADVDKQIELTHKERAGYLLSMAINELGAKKTLLTVGKICGETSNDKCVFPSSFFATETDEENMETFAIVRYVLDNWKRLSKEALKHWKDVVVPRMEKKRKDKLGE